MRRCNDQAQEEIKFEEKNGEGGPQKKKRTMKEGGGKPSQSL